MQDFDRFEEALDEARSSYMNDLSRSLSLVLDEFYKELKTGEPFGNRLNDFPAMASRELKMTYFWLLLGFKSHDLISNLISRLLMLPESTTYIFK